MIPASFQTIRPPVLDLGAIDSTNAEAKRRAETGEFGPLWLCADSQSHGRGRSGRRWDSPQGNLYATHLRPFEAPPKDAALMTFVACLAVADLLDALTGAQSRTTLKWPNDALLDGRKVAGILLESGVGWLATGIGINLAHYPGDARWPAISIAEATGRPAPAMTAAAAMLAETFSQREATFLEEGFAPIRRGWLARAAHLGDPIEVRLPNESLTGTFEDLGEDGALILGTPGGRRSIAAADIHFPE